jgi:hypothetical protein
MAEVSLATSSEAFLYEILNPLSQKNSAFAGNRTQSRSTSAARFHFRLCKNALTRSAKISKDSSEHESDEVWKSRKGPEFSEQESLKIIPTQWPESRTSPQVGIYFIQKLQKENESKKSCVRRESNPGPIDVVRR